VPNLLRRDPAALEEAIRRACAIKAAIVVEDEREQGRRAFLNLATPLATPSKPVPALGLSCTARRSPPGSCWRRSCPRARGA
jgi:hypothetical protein